jgi:hypothetical protein
MDISSLASDSSAVKSQQGMSQISVAVMKQQQDQQKQFAQAIIKMMEQTPRPSLDGTGKIVDIFA